MLQKRHDGNNRRPELETVVISFLVLSWITVLARCWVRIRMIKAFALDDWLTVLTLLFFTVYSSFVLVGTHWGVGRHMHDLTAKQRVNSMRAWFFGELFYIITTTLLRVAVGAFLLRVANKKLHRKIIYGCLAANTVFNVYYFFFTIFQCAPVQGFWTRMGGTKGVICHADISVDSTYASSAISASIDWIFGLLPIWIIGDLQMNRRKKVALGVIMGLGAIASVAPIVRIPYTITLSHSDDFLWLTVDVIVWSSVEPGIGLIVISLASLRPLFASMLAGFSSIGGTADKTASKNHGSKYYGNLSKPHSRPNAQQKQSGNNTWADDDDDGMQLHGLPPPMGHFVSIEGGSGSKQGPAKLQKSFSTANSSSMYPNTPMSGRSSEEGFGDKHRITMTQDFQHWSEEGGTFYLDKP